MKRRVSRFLHVIIGGPFVIVQVPEHHVRWTTLRGAILRAMKRDLGLPAARVSAIEGLAGHPDPTPADQVDEARLLPRLELAFAGDPEPFAAFHLYAYDAAADGCTLVRAPSKS